ncbi:hypothetical protein GS531_10735 [Rhodococcus hoagii]|nr:hypothetical protein [Prescottella equi]
MFDDREAGGGDARVDPDDGGHWRPRSCGGAFGVEGFESGHAGARWMRFG